MAYILPGSTPPSASAEVQNDKLLLYYPTMHRLQPGQRVTRQAGMMAVAYNDLRAALPNALVGDTRTYSIGNHDNKLIYIVLPHRNEVMNPEKPLHGYVYPVANDGAFSKIEGSRSEYAANRRSFDVGSPAIKVTPSTLMKQGVQVFTLNEGVTRKQWFDLSMKDESGFELVATACKQGLLKHENAISNINPIDLTNWRQALDTPRQAAAMAR